MSMRNSIDKKIKNPQDISVTNSHKWNILMPDLQESPTLSLNNQIKQMSSSGKQVFNLTAGEPDYPVSPAIKENVLKNINENKYAPSAGLPSLRSAIAENSARWYGADWIGVKNTIVTAGVKPALYTILLSLLNKGDEVIILTPAWVSYSHMIELCGGKCVYVPLNDQNDIDATSLNKAITPRTKAIIINSPHNPTGAIFSKNALDEVALLTNKHRIYVIADDIYNRITYGPCPKITGSNFDKNYLIITNGFSKSHALMGWRIGYIIAHEELISKLIAITSHILGNASLPSQYAALSALTEPDVPAFMADLSEKRSLVTNALDAMPQLSYNTPGGAFYFFINIRKITPDSNSWCEQLLAETGVALVPGDAFLAPGFVRLSYAVSREVLEQALKKLNEFVRKQK